MRVLHFIFLVALLSFFFNGSAQQELSTRELIERSKPDTSRVNLLLRLASKYYFTKPDSCYLLTKQALELSEKLDYTLGKVRALNNAGEALRFMGEFPLALDMQFQALEIHRKMRDIKMEAATLGFIGFIYMELNEFRKALEYLSQGWHIFDKNSIDETKVRGPGYASLMLSNIGNSYEKLDILDSALIYQQLASVKSEKAYFKNVKALIQTRLGNIFARQGKSDSAISHYHNSIRIAMEIGDGVNLAKAQGRLSDVYFNLNKTDSSLFYARQSLLNARSASQKLSVMEAANLLSKIFRTINKDSVIFYQDMAVAMNDSLYGAQKFRELQVLTLEEQKKQQEILQREERNKNQIKMFGLIVLLGSFLVIALILFRNVRQKQKINSVLEAQKNEIQKNLVELKSTQALLIQSEKMASLGELTAGIAHEIQNPLNFVNNFSEINTELIEELKQELKDGNLANAENIANDLVENEKKISHHGKRADSIVKGMLLHSRGSAGIKQLTDINALTDEYTRLAFHGLKARDKSFTASLKTDFDPTIDAVNVVPQEIGRVILNLVTNAFYSVSQKRVQEKGRYEPTVFISTKKNNGKLEIKIRDNGLGIPGKIVEKIFQPFFTTKPAGHGTGLGLSLSYDIVKAHNGELKVKSREGEGAEFNIILPV